MKLYRNNNRNTKKNKKNEARIGWIGVTLLSFALACAPAAEESQSEELLALQALTAEISQSNVESSSLLLNNLMSNDGPSYGSNYPGTDNGSCTFLCTKGNYNQSWKRGLCNSGKTPGVNQRFYNGHYTYKGVKWDKGGTGQDHQGVCVSTHPADSGTYSTRRIFHDGCTGYPDGNPRKMTQGPNSGWDPANWGQVFHGACVIHDLCYKAEPAFSNRSKSYCDDQMERYARQICYASYGTKRRFLRKNDRDKCLAEAANARFWLRLGSSKHYTAYNYAFDWRPHAICPAGQSYDVNRKDCR